jgi:formylglycine-generating enzyme required for sulfatase activity
MFKGESYSRIFSQILFISFVSLQIPVFAQAPVKNTSNTQNEIPKTYTQTIPGTQISFDMIGIPGGEFTMGSPSNDLHRKKDEVPQHQVKIDPFWMGKCEVTWNEYELFSNKNIEAQLTEPAALNNPKVDAVARPTPPYVEMSFGMGKDGFPVINVTHYAALMYCKYLTAKTGHFYRLPTEAEWEYACRAGTNTVYHFGNDAGQLGEYAWYYDNSNGAYKKIGTKKPNPWGLHDMYGNVAEWTMDGYETDSYAKAGATASNPWVKPAGLYPHSIRGGSWDDDPDRLRSAVRRASTAKLKERDPQIPKSNWWLTDASFLGFRIVRPLKEPTKEQIEQYFKGLPIKDL